MCGGSKGLGAGKAVLMRAIGKVLVGHGLEYARWVGHKAVTVQWQERRYTKALLQKHTT